MAPAALPMAHRATNKPTAHFRCSIRRRSHTATAVGAGPSTTEIVEIGRELRTQSIVRFHVLLKRTAAAADEEAVDEETRSNVFQLCGISRTDVLDSKHSARAVMLDMSRAKQHHWPANKKVSATSMVRFITSGDKYAVLSEAEKTSIEAQKRGFTLSDKIESGDRGKDNTLNEMLQKMKGNGMNFQVWNPGSASRGVDSELEL